MADALQTSVFQGFTFVVLPRSYWQYLSGPAVYLLARLDPFSRQVVPLYVGKSEELRGYIGPNHHKWDRALDAGMTQILFLRLHDERRRRALETRLIYQLRPPLNDQLRTTSNSGADIVRNALAVARRYSPVSQNALAGGAISDLARIGSTASRNRRG